MRTLAITQNSTVDGSIELLGDWFDPQGQAGVDNSDLLEELHQQDSRADGLLVGRQTFEDFARLLAQASRRRHRLHDSLTRVQKYVVSSTMTDPEWQNSTVLSGDPVEEIRALKEQSGQDVGVTAALGCATSSSGPDWSTNTGCSSTPWCGAAVGGCSPTGSSCRS